jgi:hypothetical protein
MNQKCIGRKLSCVPKGHDSWDSSLISDDEVRDHLTMPVSVFVLGQGPVTKIKPQQTIVDDGRTIDELLPSLCKSTIECPQWSQTTRTPTGSDHGLTGALDTLMGYATFRKFSLQSLNERPGCSHLVLLTTLKPCAWVDIGQGGIARSRSSVSSPFVFFIFWAQDSSFQRKT